MRNTAPPHPRHVKAFAAGTAGAFMSGLVLVTSLDGANAENALEMQSWCEPIATARILSPGTIHFQPTFNTGICWGAFGAIQEISRIYSDNGMVLGVCAPEDSTRDQLIKIFYKYVTDHPDTANQPFGLIARLSLMDAFPCAR